jgi:hypothetical protein
MKSEHREIARDVVKGAVAGATATWLMGYVTSWMYRREDPEAKRLEERARGGMTAYERAADKGAELADVQLSTPTRQQAGAALHWATGIIAGAIYAVARRRWRPAAGTGGLRFGTTFFLTVDELMNPLLGFTPGPQVFPWQAHARGFAGHAAFGATTELVLKGLDRVA